jgi:aspartate kinase
MTHVDPPLAAGRIPVMGGFVGATTAGVTTTLGRGGSDFSAAIVGSCLGASEIQIWTDVDGMLTADPRLVANPQVVPHLSFAEASELAYFGAKVLHPATIQPAVARNIPVRILNSQRAAARGTLITAEKPSSPTPLTAVASKKGVTVVDITSTRMLMAHGFLRRLFEVFERFRTPVDVVTTSEVSVSVTVDDRRRLPAIVEALSEFADVACEHQMAIVCAVGDGLQRDPALAAQVLASVGDVPLRLVSQAASRRNITFVIREADLPAALGRLHGRFFALAPAAAAPPADPVARA